MREIISTLERNPIIAAVRNQEDLEQAIEASVGTVFLLKSDIFNLAEKVKLVKGARKHVFVHTDFIGGLGKDTIALNYLIEQIKPDGIISTKTNLIKYAKEKGVFTIQRFFLVDSLSIESTIRTVNYIRPDMIEIMPGTITNTIQEVKTKIRTPIISGGLIKHKEEIMECLKVGALAVSTGKNELWNL